MTGIIESWLSKVGFSAVAAGSRSIYLRLRPTRITGQKAPRNFFEYFGPGATKEFVISKIGAPHRQSGTVWSYRFSDALAQFDFRESGGARSVALALTVDSPAGGFALPMIGTPLGKLHLDAFSGDREGKFLYRSSLVTWELRYCVKFLPSWASNHYTFGALSLKAPGCLRESLVDVAVASKTPRVAAKGVLVNWVGISDSSEELWFDWTIAMPPSL